MIVLPEAVVIRRRRRTAEPLVIREFGQIDELMGKVQTAAVQARDWIAAQPNEPLNLLRRMKFEPVGCHPVDGHALNMIEQINQTWTFAVALAATRKLLELHPDVQGFELAPGAHARLPLDIMSVDGQVGAETFAAVDPRNNRKLEKDLGKLALRPERHRYVFFMSPLYRGAQQWSCLEPPEPMSDRKPIEVWSVDI